MNGRNQKLRRLNASILMIAAAVFVLEAVMPAQAQQTQRPRTLLEMLFGSRNEQVEPASKPTRTPRRRRPDAASSTPGAAGAMTTAPAPAPVEKLENARRILVIGDFFAAGIADGLKEAFIDSAGVAIDERSKGSSGLVRDDYYNWIAELPLLVDEVKPAMIVVEIGANDRQEMKLDGLTEPFRSENWMKTYEARVAQLVRIAADRKIPLLWVGIPAFQSPKMTADATALNVLLRSNVEKAGGEFIDIWDGFVDENGRFVITGSDIKGQQARLRSSDGINLTAAGKRKIAFYVEKSARRHLGDLPTPDPGLYRLDGSNLPALMSLPPSEMKIIDRTPPIDVSSPELDGGSTLLGDRPIENTAVIPSSRDLLLQNGESTAPPAGRVDDYRLPTAGIVR